MRRALKVTVGADTYHDFQPACTVGVMRAVSTPRQHYRVVVMTRLLDEFDMNEIVTGVR